MPPEVGEECVVVRHVHTDGHEDELALRRGRRGGSDGRHVLLLGFLRVAQGEEKRHEENRVEGGHGDGCLYREENA